MRYFPMRRATRIDLQALALGRLQEQIITCERCPRLVEWRQRVAETKVPRFRQQTYWGRPLPSFGDPQARLLIVGLAPAAHGGNRTGRMFTGDASGDWLFRALYRAGFASQPTSVDPADGMQLFDCYISSVVRCAPPDNKPASEESIRCRAYLAQELELLPRLQVILALGQFAFEHCLKVAYPQGWPRQQRGSRPTFGHQRTCLLPQEWILLASYHPSQRNTATGKLTEMMLDNVFDQINQLLDPSS